MNKVRRIPTFKVVEGKRVPAFKVIEVKEILAWKLDDDRKKRRLMMDVIPSFMYTLHKKCEKQDLFVSFSTNEKFHGRQESVHFVMSSGYTVVRSGVVESHCYLFGEIEGSGAPVVEEIITYDDIRIRCFNSFGYRVVLRKRSPVQEEVHLRYLFTAPKKMVRVGSSIIPPRGDPVIGGKSSLMVEVPAEQSGE